MGLYDNRPYHVFDWHGFIQGSLAGSVWSRTTAFTISGKASTSECESCHSGTSATSIG
jgi:hypothetical protein